MNTTTRTTNAAPTPAGIDFLVVDQHVARNPVARAIARTRIVRATRDFATRLHMLQEGEVVHSDLQAAAKVLAVAIRLLQQRGDTTSPDARVMNGGMSALVALALRGARWHCIDAPAIDQALLRALGVYTAATALETQRAHQWVDSLDRSAAAPAAA